VIGLLWLGNWQVERGAEKRDLVRMVEARVRATPLGIETIERRRDEKKDIEYFRVKVEGRFDHAKERYFFATFQGAKGWHVYTPFKVKNGRLLMVNRGFVSDAVQSPARRPAGQIAGNTAITGLVRGPGKKGYFDPKNDLKSNIWYWRDLASMIASTLPEPEISAYPFFIEVEAAAEAAAVVAGPETEASEWPRPGVTRITFKDNHLQYAITWYGLAITLFGVYGFFLRNWYLGYKLLQRQAG